MEQKEIRIYISGAITGLPYDEAKGNFAKAETDAIRLVGKMASASKEIVLVNPMKLEHKTDATWEDYMEVDIAALLRCDMIYMMKNWQNSKGARVEHAIAIELGLLVIFESKHSI